MLRLCTHISITSIARYSFIQLNELGVIQERKSPNFEMVAKRVKVFEPGLSRLRVRHFTSELPPSIVGYDPICIVVSAVVV